MTTEHKTTRDALLGATSQPIPKMLRVCRAGGDTIQAQRAYVQSSGLHQHGDAVLLWVNEGDLAMLAWNGVAVMRCDNE